MKTTRVIKDEDWIRYYQCTSCWRLLTKEHYNRNKSWFDCLMSKCKDCMNKIVIEYRKEHKDKWNAYQRDYWRRKLMMIEQWLQELPKPENMKEVVIPIPEPTYPQPWPQPIPEPWPQKVVEVQSPKTETDGDLNKYAELYPDAYDEIMNDEYARYSFFNKWDDESKIKNLEVRQKKYDKNKDSEERKEINEKFRENAERAYRDPNTMEMDEQWLKYIEREMDKLPEKEDKRKFMKAMSNVNYKIFKQQRPIILDAIANPDKDFTK